MSSNNYNVLVRRKVIWKGKMAPKGFIYICVNVSGGKTKYENTRLIPGHTGEKTESECAKYLIDQINDQYGTKIPYPDEK